MLNNRVHTHDRVIYNEAELVYKNCSNNEKQTSESETSDSIFFLKLHFITLLQTRPINEITNASLMLFLFFFIFKIFIKINK